MSTAICPRHHGAWGEDDNCYLCGFHGTDEIVTVTVLLHKDDADYIVNSLKRNDLSLLVTRAPYEPDVKEEPDVTVRPTTSCSCGYELIWVNGEWQHDAAPYLWGDDHDANAPEPDASDPARVYWDTEDGITATKGY